MMHRRKPRGQSLLEFAIILPVLLIILAGALDLGRLYFAYVAVTDAASEGAAYAAARPDDAEAVILARAEDASYITADQSELEFFCPTCPGVASGDSVTVTVTYSFTLVTPFVNTIVPGGVIPLRAVATEVVLGGALD